MERLTDNVPRHLVDPHQTSEGAKGMNTETLERKSTRRKGEMGAAAAAVLVFVLALETETTKCNDVRRVMHCIASYSVVKAPTVKAFIVANCISCS